MAAFYTLALALAPKFVQHLVHRYETPIAKAQPVRAHRRHDLSCHWERAEDGSLVAHWVHDGAGSSDETSEGRSCNLLQEIPRALIDDAYHFERRGSVQALIAISRIARMNQSKYAAQIRHPRE
jgi:hypothetical protein